MFQNKSFPGKEREFAPRTAGTVLNDETDAAATAISHGKWEMLTKI